MSSEILHATAVSFEDKGVLILGASGSGKSALALELMALGFGLIADDRTEVTRKADDLWLGCPASLPPLIEARGVGLLKARLVPPAKLALVVDLDQLESDRLPPLREISLLGISAALQNRVDGRHFPSAILHYLKAGRSA